jgi:hypothetical protein
LKVDFFLNSYSTCSKGTKPIKIKNTNPWVGQERPKSRPETILEKRRFLFNLI